MPIGEYYDLRIGNPSPVCDLRSEWFDWFLKEVDGHHVDQDSIALGALGGAGVEHPPGLP